ncbi:MAG: potassium channel family protein [Clostridiales bacterium]|nr:potassium channel family protein [Clostridiales bacterium]
MKKRLFEIIEQGSDSDKVSKVYDFFMMAVILISLIPLTFKSSTVLLNWIDHITVGIFIIDYALRLFTAEQKLNRGAASYILYPVTPMAILDLLCILPSFSTLTSGFRILKVVRLLRSLRVLRTFKALRYSKSIDIIINVIKKQGHALILVFGMAFGYVLISALIMFNVEPEIFDTFFDAVYWATISLTSIGYGDITPITSIGRLITILSAFIGVAIIALPSGIITAGIMSEIQEKK